MRKILNLFDGIQLLEYKKEIDKLTIEVALEEITKDDKNDLEFIESLLLDFNKFENEELKNDCLFYINQFLAAKHLNKGNYNESLNFIKKILKAKPDSKYTKEMMTFAVYKKTALLPVNKESLLELETNIVTFPFLKEDKKIITQYAGFYGQLAQIKYKFRDDENGKIYFDKFEVILNKNKDLIQINPEIIADLYLKVGRFYYGKTEFSTAKNIFEKGLNYYPKHPEIEKMLKWTIEDME